MRAFAGRRIALLAPIVKGRKGHYRELFESLVKKGYLHARIDGQMCEFSTGMKLDRYKIHTIDLVVDRLRVSEESHDRLMTSLKESMRQGKGTMALYDYDTETMRYYSRHLMCSTTGVAFEDPAPHTFSFNSPKGACPRCNGLGVEAVFDRSKIIPDPKKSLRAGGIEPFGPYRNNMLFALLEMLGRRYDFTLDDPVQSISEEGMNAILYGDSEPLTVDLTEFANAGGKRLVSWDGMASAEDRGCATRHCSSASADGTSPRCRPCRSPISPTGCPASRSISPRRSARSRRRSSRRSANGSGS